jgi:HSP20 family molecular chaperone IbpA
MATELLADKDASPASATEPSTDVYESGDELVVLLRLNDGVLELRVPRQAVSRPLARQRHIPGFNPEATPC